MCYNILNLRYNKEEKSGKDVYFMFELVRFKLSLAKDKAVFADILEDFKIKGIENQKIILENAEEKRMSAKIVEDSMIFDYRDEFLEKRIYVYKNGINIKVVEKRKEKRTKGSIIEILEKTYGFTKFSEKERYLIHLISKRFIFNKNVLFSNILIDEYMEYAQRLCIFQTTFETHYDTLKKYPDSSYRYKKTLLNGEDISVVYDVVEGKDRIMRIYDLYNGIRNKRNRNDIKGIQMGLIRKESFGYKETVGITAMEDAICGASFLINQYVEELSNYPKSIKK